MTSYRVFRDCPGRQRQYIRRTSHTWAVWHNDASLAQRFDKSAAERWARVMHRRSMTDANAHPQALEPVGKYDFEEVTR